MIISPGNVLGIDAVVVVLEVDATYSVVGAELSAQQSFCCAVSI